ncbi:hypothetical protein [Pseudomonas chlororaphis]|uniref:hypothetical protein n=1 Tax=Pseudomonas chlororaphis TaxID=587753 RepID=UPI0006A6141C|nr:hypothetical protein [Pseudomonas chlororaphis]AZD02196.1 hypothetical protein C4K27_3002 [Pseudomonas chlororaphis subsp. chlororaphis]MBM0280256.1 hypothetical protein [Pseudomonas chlororaphis]MDO1505104.1 hypothetical protein [Pseudomonas chlororaphis]ORM44939.1 hypothetical protein B6D51_27570 [Pseudomonas chlororaphis subsp. chlororaphis]TWR96221.1 hypothetical protein FJD36_14840 [Pseudomonas chlororaphis subsp. chlororaphis]
MTIGYVGGWTSKAGLLVQDTGSRGKPVSQSTKVKQMLALVGQNPLALNVFKMDEMKLHKQIKGFDPENVSAKQLGNMSTFLKQKGLISDVTAMTLLNAGDKFDRFGVQADPDAKFNALEYFAIQLDNIQTNNLKGNKYASYLIPEYKKAIYVLQNLQSYGKGNGTTVTDKNHSAKA